MTALTPEDEFEALAAGMPPGQRALEAVGFYRACELPVPEWALEEIESAYANFKHGAPSAGFTSAALREVAPRSLGEAFGLPDIGREHAKARRLKSLKLPYLIALFSGEAAPPRTDAGFKAAARMLGISTAQAKDWLPTTRKNIRGHKAYGRKRVGAGVSAHDPFGQVKVPKSKKSATLKS